MKKNIAICAAVIAAATFTAITGASAQEYGKGNGALEYFDAEGIAASPQWVQIWIFIMLGTFALGLVFVWWRPIARWAVGGILASLLLGEFPFTALGLPYLSGAIAIAHIVCWSPALYLLLTQRPFLKAGEAVGFRLWCGAMTAVILFSFVFDLRDAAIYIDHFSGLGLIS